MVADRPPHPPRFDEARAGEDTKMCRHGILLYIQSVGNFPGRESIGRMTHEQAKRRQSGRLRKRVEHENRVI